MFAGPYDGLKLDVDLRNLQQGIAVARLDNVFIGMRLFQYNAKIYANWATAFRIGPDQIVQ